MKLTLFFIFLMSLYSCANVDQIDRGLLSKKIMQPTPNPEEKYFQEEVRVFREGAIGGSGAVGGGCGCN